jgi:hypothetical protein
MAKATRREGTYRSITARPGTDEYDCQFHDQALRAADAALRLWIVRIPCGLFALTGVAFLVALWIDGSASGVNLRGLTLWTSLAVLELANVALRGKLFYFRFLLSGAKFWEVTLPCRNPESEEESSKMVGQERHAASDTRRDYSEGQHP